MSEREKTNKQNQVDQLNRGLLNMLDGTANPAGRTQTNGSVDKESDIFDDIFRDFKESSKATENPTTSNSKLIPKLEPIPEPIPEPEPKPEPMPEPEPEPEPIPEPEPEPEPIPEPEPKPEPIPGPEPIPEPEPEPIPEPVQKPISIAEQETVATLPAEPKKPEKIVRPVRKSANPAKNSPHMRYIRYEDLKEEQEQKQQAQLIQAQQSQTQAGQRRQAQAQQQQTQVRQRKPSASSARPVPAADTDRTRRQDTRKANPKSGPKPGSNARKKKGPLIAVLVILGILVLLLATAVGAFFYLNKKGEAQLKKNQSIASITAPEEASSEDDGKMIVYNGAKYKYNEDNINILFMGIDRDMQDTGEKVIGENGQADVLIWAALDSKTGHLSLINISRDAMVDVNKYNVKDKYLGTDKMQLCLAYSYGDGKEKSCENTLQSVSRLMYGMPVNAYVAIDYSAIAPLNDAIGGVTVNVLEDLTQSDSALKAGETVTLHGEQAQTYVRSRNTEVLDSNNQRMERQKQYIDAFLQQTISQTKKNPTLPVTLYNDVSDYMVTNISASEVTHLATLMIQNGVSGGDILTVPGEVTQGDVYAEFNPDDKELYKLILSVFYKEIKQ
ncbi:LCP family protein [Blautia wexlerae]|uniref:LCP family protein n=1 Tax=Blautia wexlerae TaxID=418240 RepID=UPI0018A95E4A|nr:LCP family protein [Blautia wexlerae]MDB2176315.1 LCP family protein [Blautia wexlerae]MDB6439663.1 LCP family protein [Blautia wexlerae]